MLQDTVLDENPIPTLGITLGDMNGIGPEVIIKSVLDQRIFNQVHLVVYGHGKVLSFYKTLLDIEGFSFDQTESADHIRRNKLNVINAWQSEFLVKPGEVSQEAGGYAFASIQRATQDLKAGLIDGIITAPINKHNIQSNDFRYAGHTEYFAEHFGGGESLMFLTSDHLRMGVATGHIPISQVSKAITAELLETKINFMLKSLKVDFGILKPKIAVLGLNPHAGDTGLIGKEEQEIINPVIEQFEKNNHLIFGTYPADGFFGIAQHTQFDGVLAMYHDQGLIPFKSIAFETGVNFTAGLKIVRTSPDHGTAYDIAGKNLANETSMRNSIYLAKDIVKNRREFELVKN